MSGPTTLVIDVGGNNVKLKTDAGDKRRKAASGPDFTPKRLVAAVAELCVDLDYDRITVGLPTPVRGNRILLEPHNLGAGWVGFDLQAALGRPTKVVNDAVMQALGSYEGGTELFLGLGTGLGAALVIDGMPVPLEVAHLPYKDGLTFEDFAGQRGRRRLGNEAWRLVVLDIIERLRNALVADDVVIGGGNAAKLDPLPAGARLGHNRYAFVGGFRLWDPTYGRKRAQRRTSGSADR